MINSGINIEMLIKALRIRSKAETGYGQYKHTLKSNGAYKACEVALS